MRRDKLIGAAFAGLATLWAAGAPAAESPCVRPAVPLSLDAPGLIKINASTKAEAHDQFEGYYRDLEQFLAAVEMYSECLHGQVALNAITPEAAARSEKSMQIDQIRALGNWSYAIKTQTR